MAQPEQPPAPHSGGGGSFVSRKIGPLPLWAWVLIAVGILYVVVQWRANHTSGTPSAADSASQPADTNPAPITQDYITVTIPGAPPAGGRAGAPGGPPVAPPAGGSGGSASSPPPATPPKTPAPRPKGGPSPTPTPHPDGTTITVAKWRSANPPWNSTLSGIAAHEGYGGNWQAIWNAPANSALKARRKQPDLIQPGDRIIVPPK